MVARTVSMESIKTHFVGTTADLIQSDTDGKPFFSTRYESTENEQGRTTQLSTTEAVA